MPANCSTLIQRKQNILHKILRSKSERNSLEAPKENAAHLRLSISRKSSDRSPSSTHLPVDASGSSPTRRSNIFTINRIQPTNNHTYEKNLPVIRDVPATLAQQHRVYDDGLSRSRSKTPVGGASPKGPQRSMSASLSSIFNALSKRSVETVGNSREDINELKITSTRRPRPLSSDSARYEGDTNQVTTRQITVSPQKQSVVSGIDTRYSPHRPDTRHQQRTPVQSAKVRLNVTSVQVESPLTHHASTKESPTAGPLYQRRTNNSVRSPMKQKIDKYRRRSEEPTQAGNGTSNDGHVLLATTTMTLASPTSARSKLQASPSSIRRVTSDAERTTRPEVFRLSVDSNVLHTDLHRANSHYRLKPANIYSTHQELAPTHAASMSQRRSHPVPLATAVQSRPTNSHGKQRLSRQPSSKQPAATQGNIYLAFIASRHLSTLENNVPELDMDHPRVMRIFTWLQNVEDHRHQQADYDLLIAEQNQRMHDQQENFSLYSEIQYAVDDVAANTSGEPCERIPTIAFED